MLLARSLASRVRARAAQSFRSVSSDAKAPLYSERMDKTGRPISPHLMIYRLPAIAWSSVMVRITGAVASAGARREMAQLGLSFLTRFLSPLRRRFFWPRRRHIVWWRPLGGRHCSDDL